MDYDILPDKFDEQQKLYLKEMFSGSFGDPVILDADATTAGQELKNPNDVGFNPSTNAFFININGNTYKVVLTSV